MKFSMAGQYKGDCLIEVTAWTGLTVFVFVCKFYFILIFISTYPYAYTLPSVVNVFTKNSLCIMTEFIDHKCAIRLLQHCT
jgi:hypothetical protein